MEAAWPAIPGVAGARSESGWGEVVDRTLESASEVAEDELREGRKELRQDVEEAFPGSVLLGVSILCGAMGLMLVGIGAAKKLVEHPVVALAAGACLIGIGVAAGLGAREALPQRPFGRVREHVARDVEPLKH